MKNIINFEEAKLPITEPVTKFGGQPVWIEKPEWAISKSTGKPMMFICQIALDKEIFGSIESKMAYVFMSDDEDNYIEGTWEADGGENAVIIQPNGNNPESVSIEAGQSLSVWKEIAVENNRKPFACEFAVPQSKAVPDTEEDDDEGNFENKIGGIPHFLQGEEFPDNNPNNWKLLLQLDSSSVPFEINFGDAGVGYAFISNDGITGKFLWQCC